MSIKVLFHLCDLSREWWLSLTPSVSERVPGRGGEDPHDEPTRPDSTLRSLLGVCRHPREVSLLYIKTEVSVVKSSCR